MYATIQHCERGAASTDDLAQAGHALAAHLSKTPGFVAYLLVEMPGGGHAAVCIFEDRAELAAADELVAWPAPAGSAGQGACPAVRITGEVIAQRGL